LKVYHCQSCSGTSRKTRIETPYKVQALSGKYLVAVELPEKQGLKHYLASPCTANSIHVAVELPEKQGLKHLGVSGFRCVDFRVAVELPEKQGLKQMYEVINSWIEYSCSGTSRKTRIETQHYSHLPSTNLLLQWNFQKNKD